MADKKISALPSGTANASAVVPATNAAGTTTEKITLGAIAALGGGPPASHTHGNISNAGAIGTTANLPVITGASGVLAAGSFGTASNTFCQGNDSRLSDSREWTADTVSQAEAETGTATTRRAWTAQRVAQSAAAARPIASAAQTLAGTSDAVVITPEKLHLSRRGSGRAKFWEAFNDFAFDFSGNLAGSDGFIFGAQNSGTGATMNLYANKSDSFTEPTAGILTVTTGTTNTGRGGFDSFQSSIHRADTGTTTYEALLYIPTLATVAEDYVLRIGYVKGSGIDQQCVCFEYDRAASANWQCVTGDAGSFTRKDSTVAVDASKWIKLRVVFTSTSAVFSINGVDRATNTTHIRATSQWIGGHIVKTAGTTARTFLLDYVYARHDFTTDRTHT